MPASIQCPPDFPVSSDEVAALWEQTRQARDGNDDIVSVRCIDEAEMQQLNKQYRNKDAPTNVLTFSYEGEHDIALCVPVAEREASAQNIKLRDYLALLLVHAFLHATDLDHERSEDEEVIMRQTEQDILGRCGFSKISLQ